MSEEVGIGGTGGASVRRTRLVLIAFGVAAVLAIAGSLALPPLMIERAVDACAAEGGTYDRATATCVRA